MHSTDYSGDNLCGWQRSLKLTQLSLGGGAEIDLTPLSSVTTLEEASFQRQVYYSWLCLTCLCLDRVRTGDDTEKIVN
jgi:hypothetical protein